MTQNHRSIIALLVSIGMAVWAYADSPYEDYGLATNYYQQSRWAEAAESFAAFLAKYPEHEKAPLALFYRGEALVQSQNYAGAGEAFTKFVATNAEHRFARQALYRSGEMAHLMGRREQAREALSKFCEKYATDPIRAYALPYLGEIELRDGNYVEAEARYREAINSFPDGAMIDACRFGMGRSLESQNRIDEALRFYEYLSNKEDSQLADDAQMQIGLVQYNQRQFDQSIAGLVGFLEKHKQSPLRADAIYWLGMNHYAKGEWQRSADVFQRLLPSAAGHQLEPAIHFVAGEANRRLGQRDTAKSHYGAVVEKWPTNEWADDSLEALIQFAFEDDDHENVESLTTAFNEQFADSTRRPVVQQVLGRSLLKRDEFNRAVAVLEDLTKSVNDSDTIDSSSVYYLLALAYIGDQKFQPAVDAIAKIKPDETNQEFTANVSLARATAQFALKNYAEAASAQRKYLELLPNGADAARCRAELVVSLANQQQFADALDAFHQLEKHHPDYLRLLETMYFLAESAYSKDQRPVAQELFEKLADEKNPAEFVQKGLYGLAWLRSDSNNTEKSAETFRRLLEKFPNSDTAPEAAVMQARSLQAAGKLIDASDAYLFLVEEYPQSKYVAEALLAAARIQSSSGSPDGKVKAVELFQRFQTQFPENENLDAALYDLAWVLRDLQREQETSAVFAHLHEEFPNSTFWGDVTYRLAEEAAKNGDVAKAKSLTSSLIDAEVPDEIRCHALYLSGQLAADEADWEHVTKSMGVIVAEHPNSSLVLPAEYWVGESLYRRGEFEEAHRRLLALADKIADRDDVWLAMVPLRLAQILAQDKKWEESLVIARGIEKRFPNFRQQFEADYVIGRCLANQAKFSHAREHYERVVRSTVGGKTETAAMAQWMIGETYFHQKNYDEAIQAFHRVETLYAFPQWQAAALLQAGKCYEKKDDFRSAVKVYAQLLKHHADSASSKEASQRLRLVKEKLATVAG